MTTVLGIDIGGTGIKGAPVDTRSGQLLADRHRILTPHPATPDAVAGVVAEVARFFEWTGPTGATFPAIVKDGVAYSAANVDPSWIGTNAAQLFTEAIGGDVTVINDADAAGDRRAHLRRGQGPRGRRDHDHPRDRHRQRAVRRRHARAQHRARPPEDGQERRRGARRPTACARSRTCRGRSGRSASRSTSRWSRRCSPPTSSSSAAGSARRRTSSSPAWTSTTEIVPAQLLNEAGIVGAALAHAQRAGVPHTD